MTDDRGGLRISNDDREDAIEQLQQALDEGRIDLDEFEERSRTAYAAKTNAELDLIFEDLPVGRDDGRALQRAEPASADGTAAVEEDDDPRMSGLTRALIWVACTTVPVWLYVMIETGEAQGFWPLWPLLALGGVAMARGLTGDGGRSRRRDRRRY